MRTLVAWLVIVGMSTPALAGDLQSSIAKAAQQQTQTQDRPIPRAYFWPGMALFAGGMTVGIYGFLNNRNGSFPEFGEATATNKPLGTAGLAAAFVGGTILFLGERKSRRAPMVTFGPNQVGLSKRVSW